MFDEKCRNIIVVSAHPMAADVGVGGIMAQAVKKGLNVHLIVMSRGETGVPGIPRNILATLREEEQRKACKELGVENIHFLGFRCNEIYDTRETRLALIKIFRRLKADVYAHEFTWHDHEELVEFLLTEWKGKAMVSGYINPIYKRLEEAGWIRKDIEVALFASGKPTTRNPKQRKRDRVIESVWMNYKLPQRKLPIFSGEMNCG